jgi:hypothetical protein
MIKYVLQLPLLTMNQATSFSSNTISLKHEVVRVTTNIKLKVCGLVRLCLSSSKSRRKEE